MIAGLPLAPDVRELLLSPDEHQRALLSDGVVACVVHDFAREFDEVGSVSAAPLHFALTPTMMVTARRHPVQCADIVKRRIDGGAPPRDAATALDILIRAMLEISAAITGDLTRDIQAIEDALLESGREPQPRDLPAIRRRAVLAQRQLAGLHRIFDRLEEDEELPEPLAPVLARIIQRVAALESDVEAVQGQTRLLRDELDLRSSQRTNQNLYVLSIMTALMLPATLVTGLFGMNTGGLAFASSPHGTLAACLLAVCSSLATYVLLRLLGFFGGIRR